MKDIEHTEKPKLNFLQELMMIQREEILRLIQCIMMQEDNY